MTPMDAAYLAGLLDGEGTIGARLRANGYTNLELGICMTTPAPLYWAKEVTGFGEVYHRPERRENRQDAWFWKVGRCDEIASVLREVRPYMKVKQGEASAFLVLANLRSMKRSRFEASPHPEGERMAADLVTAMKRDRSDPTTLHEEAMDLCIYLKGVMVERDSPR